VARLVVFDLDGTLTRHGTLGPYLLGLLAQRPWQLLRFIGVAPALIAYLLGRIDRGRLKATLLAVTLHDRSQSDLQAWTQQFVPRMLARAVHADALKVIAAHRVCGDRLVLLSASPDLYVPAIAAQLQFDEVVCTGLRWSAGRLDGMLTTPNRRDAEKTRCLMALQERYPGLRTAAYANAASDLDHLQRVDEPVLVNGSHRARREAARLGIRSERWS